jgi:hypothetical protein
MDTESQKQMRRFQLAFALVALSAAALGACSSDDTTSTTDAADAATSPDSSLEDTGSTDAGALQDTAPNDATTPSDAAPSDAAEASTTGSFSIAVSSGDLRPAFSPDVHDYELSAFTTLIPVSLTLSGRSGTVGGQAVAPGVSYVLPSPSVTPSSQISVSVAGDDAGVYVIHLAPQDLPAYSVTVDNPGAGHVFMTAMGGPAPYLLVIGTGGDVEYYQRVDVPTGSSATAFGAAADFKKQILTNGAVRYTYSASGTVHVLDESFKHIASHQLLATATHPAVPCGPWEFLLLEDDHYIAIALINETVQNVPDTLPHPASGALVQGSVVQEVKAGQVVFEWDSTSYPELYALSVRESNFNRTTNVDYAHINSVEIDPMDGDLVLSFRNLDAILKVRHTDGSIVWRLGGPNDSFATTAAQKTSGQHYARFLPDGRLLVFDNGFGSSASRVVVYGLNQPALTLQSFASFPLNTFTGAQGSVQRVGNLYFVGLGLKQPGGSDVLAINPTTGQRAFELRFTAPRVSYRALFTP